MPVFRTVLKVPLQEGSELHVVAEDASNVVYFSLHTNIGQNPSTRTTIRLTKAQSYRIAMFLAGLGNLDNTAERILVAKANSAKVDHRFDDSDVDPLPNPPNKDWDDLKTPREKPMRDITEISPKGPKNEDR